MSHLMQLFGLDAKRPSAWQQYGYPDQVTFQQLLLAYERQGPGNGAVHRLLDRCWQGKPRIKQPEADKSTQWEQQANKVLTDLQAWKKLIDFDRRNLVGRYAGLILRFRDGKALSEPVQGRNLQLADIVPVFESQLQVVRWNTDKSSESYGKPAMFGYRLREPGADSAGAPDEWADLHPDRVIIMAEGSVGDFTEGVPLLRAGFNELINLEKISGGSGESFLKNSSRTVVFQYDPQANPAVHGTDGKSVREAHEEQVRGLNRNIDSSIVLQGGEASTLQTQIADPTGPFTMAANLFAASVRIPFTILFGQQTGRLASDEDQRDFNARCASRQELELTPMLTEFVRRLQAAGTLPAGEFEIEWPSLDAPNDNERFDQLGKLTAAMQQAMSAGLAEPLFDANELRKVAGYEPRADDGMPTEGAAPEGVMSDEAGDDASAEA